MESIFEATRQYERWMRLCMPIVDSALREKHNEMRDDVVSFLRATYYRWAQLFPVVCAELTRGPRILAVGDLHIGSFGTWRESEGRLCWGVDDFDQSHPLPYANDLVRLAASVRLVGDDESIGLRFRKACDTILEGYECTLRDGPDRSSSRRTRPTSRSWASKLSSHRRTFGRHCCENPRSPCGNCPETPELRSNKRSPRADSSTRWCGGKPEWAAWASRAMSPLRPGKVDASPEKRRPTFPQWKPTGTDAAMTVPVTTKRPSEQPPGLLIPISWSPGNGSFADSLPTRIP